MSFSIKATTLGPGEGRVIQVPGHPITYKATAEETGGAYSLLEVVLEVWPETSIPPRPAFS